MTAQNRIGVAALLAAAFLILGGAHAPVAADDAANGGASSSGNTQTGDPGAAYRSYGNDSYYIGDYYKNLGYPDQTGGGRDGDHARGGDGGAGSGGSPRSSTWGNHEGVAPAGGGPRGRRDYWRTDSTSGPSN